MSPSHLLSPPTSLPLTTSRSNCRLTNSSALSMKRLLALVSTKYRFNTPDIPFFPPTYSLRTHKHIFSFQSRGLDQPALSFQSHSYIHLYYHYFHSFGFCILFFVVGCFIYYLSIHFHHHPYIILLDIIISSISLYYITF